MEPKIKHEMVSCKKHQLVFVKNIYGNAIKSYGLSEWKCSVCGKTKFKNYYNKIEG